MSEEPHEINYDEAKVPDYTLPDLLARKDGTFVQNAYEWSNFQRGYWKRMLEDELYGPIPPKPAAMSYRVLEVKPAALDGKALRKRVLLEFQGVGQASYSFELLIYIPAAARTPAPVLCGLNFCGNQGTTPERDLPLPTHYLSARKDYFSVKNRATEESRCIHVRRWLPELLVSRGYASVTACYQSICPDHAEGALDSVYRLFYTEEELRKHHEECDLGAISAWAWGLSRMMDYIECDPQLDETRVCVTGLSRLGKASLWAGCCDQRFAVVSSNCSGCGGSALSRRRFGETFGSMAASRTLWFNKEWWKYAWHSAEQPFDQHCVMALAAPRPLYIASASEDLWADPKGEYLALDATRCVYRLFGMEPIPKGDFPGIEQPVSAACAYHCRRGKHEMLEYDYLNYLAFLDRFFSR